MHSSSGRLPMSLCVQLLPVLQSLSCMLSATKLGRYMPLCHCRTRTATAKLIVLQCVLPAVEACFSCMFGACVWLDLLQCHTITWHTKGKGIERGAVCTECHCAWVPSRQPFSAVTPRRAAEQLKQT